MKISFFVGRFPALSETFIVQQITGLIDHGHDVYIYAFIPPQQSETQKEVIEYNLLKKTTYIQLPKTKKRLRINALQWLFKCFFLKPHKTTRLLASFFKNRAFS